MLHQRYIDTKRHMKMCCTLYSIEGAINSNNKDIPPTVPTEWGNYDIIKCRWGSGGRGALLCCAGIAKWHLQHNLLTVLKHIFNMLLSNCPLGFYLEDLGLYPYKNLHEDIYKCLFIITRIQKQLHFPLEIEEINVVWYTQ